METTAIIESTDSIAKDIKVFYKDIQLKGVKSITVYPGIMLKGIVDDLDDKKQTAKDTL